MAVDANGNEIIEPAQQQSNRAEERIKELSDKVEITAKERDELKGLNDTTTRERDFYKGFSDVLVQNPSAKEHEEEIREKTLKGYTLEDATYAVLGKAGKLGAAASAPQSNAQQVAGGSATTNPGGSTKEVKDMTQDERRAQLAKELFIS